MAEISQFEKTSAAPEKFTQVSLHSPKHKSQSQSEQLHDQLFLLLNS